MEDREFEGKDSVGMYLSEIARTPLLDAERGHTVEWETENPLT